MHFKSHPYYDDSAADDWLALKTENRANRDAGDSRALNDFLLAEKQRLCELALTMVRTAAGESYLAERPHPSVNEFLYIPINDTGFRVYIEFFFSQNTEQNAPDSDFWWAIINGPNAGGSPLSTRRQEHVIGLGWYVA